MIHPQESLQFKILIAIILSLLFLLTICFYLLIRTQRTQFLAELQAEAIGFTDMVYDTLERSMLQNDVDNIVNILSAIQKQERVKNIAVLNLEGRIAFSPYSSKEEPSQQFDCRRKCHVKIPEKLNYTVFLKSKSLLRSVQYLLNAPKCQKCHGNGPVRGVLAMDISMVDVGQKIAKSTRRMLLFGILILLSAIFIIAVALRKLVIKPVQRLVEGTQQLGMGELSYRLKKTKEKDEVGRLIDSFNQMADMLESAHNKLESWNEELQREVAKKHQDLQKRNSELAMLLEVSTQALVSANLESLLENLIIKTTEVFDSDASALFLLNSERAEFTVFATEGRFQGDKIVKIPAEYGTPGWILTHDQPLIICDTKSDARCEQMPNVPRFRSILSVPIKIKGKNIGVLETVHLLPNFYREEQLEFLMSIANLAAIAIDNANYSERQSQLLKQIISAQEEERKRVARELHDETGQALTALMINLDLIEAKLPSAVKEVTGYLQDARDVVEQMKDEIHELIYRLRPSILDNLGLLPAVRSYARSMLGKMNIEVDLHVTGFKGERLSAEKEICLFRVIQEAFANIAKHAKASVVTVQIERQQDIIRIIIEDDGVGFDVDKVLNPTHKDSGFGIRGMEERVRLLGGNFSLDSQVGFGTQLLIEIPIDAEEESNDEQNQSLSGR